MQELAAMIRMAQGPMQAKRLAELSGIDPSKISKLRNGALKETPSPSELEGLSNALNIPQFRMLQALDYDVGPPLESGTDRVDHDDDLSPAVARAVKDWTPSQRKAVWSMIESVTAIMDEHDPPNERTG